MLCLAGVLLSCSMLCLASPVPPTARNSCTIIPLIRETLSDVLTLKSKGGSEITLLENMPEEGANITSYLDRFIEALKSGKETLNERLIAHKLQQIRDAGKSCLWRMEQEWESVEDKEVFDDLEYLLRFLNHKAPLAERA